LKNNEELILLLFICIKYITHIWYRNSVSPCSNDSFFKYLMKQAAATSVIVRNIREVIQNGQIAALDRGACACPAPCPTARVLMFQSSFLTT
jgi:hypothetical protein